MACLNALLEAPSIIIFTPVCTCYRGAPCLVSLKSNVIQIAAGSNHTVLLTQTGQVFTFGNYKVYVLYKCI